MSTKLNAEDLAAKFHETYERLAPSFGYETRPDTKAFDPSTPNGKLMTAVCAEVAQPIADQRDKLLAERDRLRELARWIPVEERMPEDLVTVWLANPKHGIAFIGCAHSEDEGWCWAKSNGCTYIKDGAIVAECEDDDYEITHWMPLPAPPDAASQGITPTEP